MSSDTVLAYDYPLLGAFWTILWIFLWILWLFLLFRIVIDLFRDDTMGGWGKAGWVIFLMVVPFIGVLIYLLVRGRGMGTREVRHAQARHEAFDAYVRETAARAAPGASEADQLAKLSEMHNTGHLSDEEFRRAKERILH